MKKWETIWTIAVLAGLSTAYGSWVRESTGPEKDSSENHSISIGPPREVRESLAPLARTRVNRNRKKSLRFLFFPFLFLLIRSAGGKVPLSPFLPFLCSRPPLPRRRREGQKFFRKVFGRMRKNGVRWLYLLWRACATTERFRRTRRRRHASRLPRGQARAAFGIGPSIFRHRPEARVCP